MIKFEGRLSKQCVRCFIRKNNKLGFIVTLFVSPAFGVPTLYFLKDNVYLFVVMLCYFIAIPIFALLTPPNKNHCIYFPTMVVIDGNLLTFHGQKITVLREIEHVKSVVDYGDWYHILFYFPHIDYAFLCQKDLLVEGTIEEFEEIFEEVMVRKIKKK